MVILILGLSILTSMFVLRPASGGQTSLAPSDVTITGDVSDAAWSAKCQPSSQRAAIDPIKYYGTTAPHTHEFFAPTSMSSTVDPNDLLSLPKSAIKCTGPTRTPFAENGCSVTPIGEVANVCDKSAYWVPELAYDTAPTNVQILPHPLEPHHMNVYWRNEYTYPSSVSTFPADLAVVGGNAGAGQPQDKWIVNWQCADDAAPNGKIEIPGPDSPTIPETCDFARTDVCHPDGIECPLDKIYLRLVVTFPECVVLSSVSTAGMQTPTTWFYNMTNRATPSAPTNGTGYYDCPSGYLEIPTIQVDPHWLIAGPNNPNAQWVPETDYTDSNGIQRVSFDLSNLWLTSDIMMLRMGGSNVVPGQTAHADYENGYTGTDIIALVDKCFHHGGGPGRNCGFI